MCCRMSFFNCHFIYVNNEKSHHRLMLGPMQELSCGAEIHNFIWARDQWLISNSGFRQPSKNLRTFEMTGRKVNSVFRRATVVQPVAHGLCYYRRLCYFYRNPPNADLFLSGLSVWHFVGRWDRQKLNSRLFHPYVANVLQDRAQEQEWV